jgi:MATE family multidrug resistance protein
VRRAAFAGFGLGASPRPAAARCWCSAGARSPRCTPPTPACIALAVTLMLYAAVFQLPDGVQVLSNGVLRGLKDTRVPMLVTVFAYWCVGLPLGAWFGLAAARRARLWLGLILGLSVAATRLSLRVCAPAPEGRVTLWRMSRRPRAVESTHGFPEFSCMSSPGNPNPFWSFLVGVGKFINFANTLVFNL